MPHIDIKMFPGRDEKTKKAFAEKVIDTAVQELGCSREVLSVAIEDITPEKWNAEVADKVNEADIKAGKLYRAK